MLLHRPDMKRRLAAGALLVLAACSSKGADSNGQPASGTDDIIGGVDAKSAALDAVGAIMVKDPTTQQYQMLCSATLIGKDVVLSAKHCAVQFANGEATADGGPPSLVEQRFIDSYEMYFAIGFDTKTARMVKMSRVEVCSDYVGGAAGIGCDVSIYRLAEEVNDVRPLKIANPPGEDQIGKRDTAVGYGAQNVPETLLGTRKAGSLTVKALHGAPLAALYPTLDALGDALTATEGVAFVQNNADLISQMYATPLKEGYEVYVGTTPGDAQVCHGDSGGPLLQKVNGELVVVGVASTVGFSGTKLPCTMGAVYATFGPKAQELIQANLAADPCAGIPALGKCDGDVAIRCTNADEGPRQVVKNDCSLLLTRCIPPTEASDAGDAGDASAPSAVSCGE